MKRMCKPDLLISVFMIMLMIMIFLLTGCGAAGAVGQRSEIKVFAAASLTESFTELAKEYEHKEGGRVKVLLNFAGSQTLKTSIEAGTKADIFASANRSNMEELKKKGLVDEDKVFVKNKLVLVKNRKSKYIIGSLADLTAEGLKIAVGDKSVPVGSYWEKALNKAFEDGTVDGTRLAGIEKNIKTRELNVKDVVSKVLANEVDAGVVYRTDVNEENSKKLEFIELPLFEKFIADYPIAILKDSKGQPAVKKFYEYILSDKGKDVFRRSKFIVE